MEMPQKRIGLLTQAPHGHPKVLFEDCTIDAGILATRAESQSVAGDLQEVKEGGGAEVHVFAKKE